MTKLFSFKFRFNKVFWISDFFSIPNCITLLNLFCGVVASLKIIQKENSIQIFILIFFSLLFDFLDGFVARLIKQNSLLGSQLDSLADVISFGLVPGLLSFNLLNETSLRSNVPYIGYLGFIITLFSALRLAKFNLEMNVSLSYFQGLNTPTCTVFMFSLYYFFYEHNYHWIANFYFLIVLVAILSCLLISSIPMFSLKFNTRSSKNKRLIIIFFIISLFFFLLFQIQSIPFIIVFYVIYSIMIKNHLS